MNLRHLRPLLYPVPDRRPLYSLIKASVYCMAATLIHCYYGYFASGGPVGVGDASGRAVRASLVTIMVLDLTMTVMLWGLRPVYVFKG